MKDLPIKAILVPLFALVILFVLMLIVLSRWIIGYQGDTAATDSAVAGEVMTDDLNQSGDIQSDRISRVGGGSQPAAITEGDAESNDLVAGEGADADGAMAADGSGAGADGAMADGSGAGADGAMAADGSDAGADGAMAADGSDAGADGAMAADGSGAGADGAMADGSGAGADGAAADGSGAGADGAMAADGSGAGADGAMADGSGAGADGAAADGSGAGADGAMASDGAMADDSAEGSSTIGAVTGLAAGSQTTDANTAVELQAAIKAGSNGQVAGVPSAIIGLTDGGDDTTNAAPPAGGEQPVISTGSTAGGGSSNGSGSGAATGGATNGIGSTDGTDGSDGTGSGSGAATGDAAGGSSNGTDGTGSAAGAGGNGSGNGAATGDAAAGSSNGAGGADSDNDGVADSIDNCANTINADQRNMDGDAVGDVCDSDMDGDGIANAIDNCSTIPNPEQGDLDQDGIGDVCEAIGGISFGTASGDRDDDTILDGIDNCIFTINPNQVDSDGDGVGDLCDADVDGDGLANTVDNCVSLVNPGQEDSDSNGIGDVCTSGSGNDDGDADGIVDAVDNCVYIVNPSQDDLDNDGLGDACDADLDADERNNAIDNCLIVANSAHVDSDKNGVGDACEVSADAPAAGTIVEVAADTGNFTTLLTALDAAELTSTFADANAGPFTVFAPTDDVFETLPEGVLDALLLDPSGDLTKILQYHVVNGVLPSSMLVRLDSVTTLLGEDISLQVVDNTLVLNDSVEVTMTDIKASNGVIHVIDSVLIPSNDRDQDGFVNSVDNCADVANVSQRDLDDDGIGNACDEDVDGDGVANVDDNCMVTVNGDQVDADNNGVGDACEATDDANAGSAGASSDIDEDGILNSVDNCALVPNSAQEDMDGDGVGDACDSDIDGDQIVNRVDNCVRVANVDQADANGDGYGDACADEAAIGSGAGNGAADNSNGDSDGDGIANGADNCAFVANLNQKDSDGDNIGDVCDNDIDGDGVANAADNCVTTPNIEQIDADGDGVGNACEAGGTGADAGNGAGAGSDTGSGTGNGAGAGVEGDQDGVPFASDNCAYVDNSDQADLDGDGVGDACDGDVDGDNVANDADNCLTVPNANQADTDGDGIGNVCETNGGGTGAGTDTGAGTGTGTGTDTGAGTGTGTGTDTGAGTGTGTGTGTDSDDPDSIYTPPPGGGEDGDGQQPIISTGNTSGLTAGDADANNSGNGSGANSAGTTTDGANTSSGATNNGAATSGQGSEDANAIFQPLPATEPVITPVDGTEDPDTIFQPLPATEPVIGPVEGNSAAPQQLAAGQETRQSSYGQDESDSDAPRVLAAPFTVYKNTLPKGWEDRSWDANVNFAGFPAYDGLTAMTINFKEPNGGVYLYSPQAINIENYNVLRFFINGGVIGGQQINVALVDENENILSSIPLSPPYADNWRQIDILLEDLGNPAAVHGIVLQDALGAPQSVFFVDEVSFEDDPLASRFDPTEADGPGIMVFTTRTTHDISKYIYGMNFASETVARELKLPVNRWGGNAVSRYNYITDSTNVGNNWYFENIQPRNPSPTLPNNSSADKFFQQNIRTETATLMTVPMLGWVANEEHACGFNVEKYGDQVEIDEEWRPECGGGVLVDGTVIETGEPTDTSIPAGPGFVQGWINHINTRFGTASESEAGVRFYNLDNEPMIWSHTHRDLIAEDTLDTATFIDRSIEYASAVKQADPSADTLGPVFWGWSSFFWSDVDIRADNDPKVSAPDQAANGGIPLAARYLQQMAAHEAETGNRVLDLFDLHFYPQASGVAFSEVGGQSIQALRLRSTRALWDASYVDESWVGEPVNLIPRMHDWIDEYYPETGVAISEYNWGGLEHINGAIAQADVLGIFGREEVDLATLWGPPEKKDPGMFAFRMYRNYDGKGAEFGDQSVAAESENQDQLSVYAARSSVDGKLTVMVLNKATVPFNSFVTLDGMDTGSAEAFRYSKANLGAIERMVPQAFEGGEFLGTFPAESITLYVVE